MQAEQQFPKPEKGRNFQASNRARRVLRSSAEGSPPNGAADFRMVDVSRPPARVVQSEDEEFILIPRRAWQRLHRRVRFLPKLAPGWIMLTGVLLGVAFSQPALAVKAAFFAVAGMCFVAHLAVNRSKGSLRHDIADEMQSHEPLH